jgi:hypothetical protein
MEEDRYRALTAKRLRALGVLIVLNPEKSIPASTRHANRRACPPPTAPAHYPNFHPYLSRNSETVPPRKGDYRVTPCSSCGTRFGGSQNLRSVHNRRIDERTQCSFRGQPTGKIRSGR